MRTKLFSLFVACIVTSSLQSCAQVDVKQMTYKALRQQDCRINEPNTFCERGFSAEYQEYERIRQEYIRGTQSEDYRAELDDSEEQVEPLLVPSTSITQEETQDIAL